MVNKRKVEIVDELADLLAKSELAILTDYRGLTVAEMAQLRQQLREFGVEYHVAKNTLVRFAAEKAGYPDMSAMLTGPTAIAFAKDDVAKAAKALKEYARTSKVFAIKGGVISRRVLSAEEVGAIADLPPKEVLIAKVIGTAQAPIVNLVSVLGGPIRSFAYVLQARAQQLQGA